MSPRFRAAAPLLKKPGMCFPITSQGPESPRHTALHRASGRHSGRMVFFLLIAAMLIFTPTTAIIFDNNNHQERAGTSDRTPANQKPDNMPGALVLPPGSADNGQKPGTAPSEPVGIADNVTLPFIANNNTAGVISRQYTFSFQKSNITITTNVSNAAYYGAKNGDKFAIISQETAPESLASDYYRAFVDDPHQDLLYADLLKSFRTIRTDHRYSDDEYLELLTIFVQSLPYDNESAAHPDNPSRFPVETIVEGTGDCDDKSVLLAGLLSREGYNVSLLLFIPEHHMAVGVSGDRMQYRDTGYIYVETTGVSFMGDIPRGLNQSVKYVPSGEIPQINPITSLPVVIRVGSGPKMFTSTAKTEYILLQKKAVDARIALLRVHLNTTSDENTPRYRTLRENYYTYTGIHNYIVKHEQDRVGTYRYLTSQMPPDFFTGSSTGERTCTVFFKRNEIGLAWYLPCPQGICQPQHCV
ncbi:MAG: hypothetical protein Q7T80_07365 [Methanoregula sp.]|nr:hypothetical protein [Methanoregula sp.]